MVDGAIPHKNRLPSQIEKGGGIAQANLIFYTMTQIVVGMGEGIVGRMAGGTADAAVSLKGCIVE